MEEEDFKMKVVKDIAEIKTSLRYMLDAQKLQRPCIQDKVSEKIKSCEKGVSINRKLIYAIGSTLITFALAAVAKAIKP